MYASHASLRDDYEASREEFDAVVEIAGGIGHQGGVFGCRMTGDGLGSCCVALTKANGDGAVAKKMAAAYKARTGVEAVILSSPRAAEAAIVKS